MSLYVRRSAWLHTAPDRAEGDKSKARPLSRLELDAKIWAAQERGRKKEDYQPSMPPLGVTAYLFEYFHEIGPAQAAGMSVGPISYSEIFAWQSLTGIALQPWESRLLRRLSQDYIAESSRAQKRDCKSPWAPGQLAQI